jgi:hemin uptake protein HemP
MVRAGAFGAACTGGLDFSGGLPPPSPPPDGKAAQEPLRDSWRSEELLGNRSEVQIIHNNEIYRVRRTRHGKLILYK